MARIAHYLSRTGRREDRRISADREARSGRGGLFDGVTRRGAYSRRSKAGRLTYVAKPSRLAPVCY
jgi:hypothetical protein